MLLNIDHRIQGLPHSTDEQEDDTRKGVVNKLTHKFETHPDREALKTDLTQNQAYNPFSENSKNLIHSMANVEFFEMCEISPGVQCLHRLTYWTTGKLYCTCGTCQYLTEKTRKRIRDRFDTLSIPHNVIKKGPLHVAPHGNAERQRIYHAAHTAAKKANEKGI